MILGHIRSFTVVFSNPNNHRFSIGRIPKRFVFPIFIKTVIQSVNGTSGHRVGIEYHFRYIKSLFLKFKKYSKQVFR